MRSSILTSVLTVLVFIVTVFCETSRNVKDFGAKGDGSTDDTNAIILALTEGRGDNTNPYGSTTYSSSTKHPMLVYFPAGTYVVTKPLPVIYYTQMVGDSANMPTILYKQNNARLIEVAGSWYTGVNQNNFYRQIRNFVFDLTQCDACTAVHWQVAQATSLTNIYFKMGVGSKSQGIWMENGSGGFISDLVFEGGIYGLWIGNQQFTSRNITIKSASVCGIYLNWDWGWEFSGLKISDSPVGVDVAAGTGSLLVVDSEFDNVGIAVRTTFNNVIGVNSVLIDNVKVTGEANAVVVQNANGNNALTVPSGSVVKSWAQGHVWEGGQNTVKMIDLSSRTPARPSSLVDSDGNYFTMTRPQYVGETIINVNTLGVVGDGNTDVTDALQKALNNNAGKAVLFFPHGTYIISNTVTVPAGTRIYGEVWSVLMASGAAFQDAKNPVPMLKVGTPGQTGVAQMSDFLISTKGPQPGAKLIEWNMHDPAGEPGSCGMWDLHWRVGGADGTNMQPSNCPNDNGARSPASQCTGAWALLHVTRSGNVYMENVWGWVADHDIDLQNQVNIYNWRGFLIESQGPMWLYGTAAEHSVLYQYNFNGAKDVFMGLIQTETPYYQPSTSTPFSRDAHPTDPEFCHGDARCEMAYGLVITNSTDVYLYGAGLYSFFNTWDQGCLKVTPPNCQINMANITSTNTHVYAFNTYGSQFMRTSEIPYSAASQNANTFCSSAICDLNLF